MYRTELTNFYVQSGSLLGKALSGHSSEKAYSWSIPRPIIMKILAVLTKIQDGVSYLRSLRGG